MGAGVGCRL